MDPPGKNHGREGKRSKKGTKLTSGAAAAATSGTKEPTGASAATASGTTAQSTGSVVAPAPGAPVPGTQGTAIGWWPPTSYGGPIMDDSSPSGEWAYPPGGYMNFLHSPGQHANPFGPGQHANPFGPGQHGNLFGPTQHGNLFGPAQHANPFSNSPHASNIPENFHLVGGSMSQSTMSPTVPSPYARVAADGTDTQLGSQDNTTIDVDADETIEPSRSEVRLTYTIEEDIRLASAWLHNSIDPIDGNDKKGDKYWTDVTATYNSTTERHRLRNRNQLKLRWERIKKPVGEFNGCFARVTKLHRSGMSDDQIMEHAMEIYASEHGGKQFQFPHVWKVVRHEKKWAGCCRKLGKEKENCTKDKPTEVVNLEDNLKQRPMGHKRAKEERNGKRKTSDVSSATNEKLEKFIEACTLTIQHGEKMSTVQDRLADKKLEAAKLTHKAAQEQTKCKMLQSYTELSLADTSNLNEQALAERNKVLECMRQSLFGTTNQGPDLN